MSIDEAALLKAIEANDAAWEADEYEVDKIKRYAMRAAILAYEASKKEPAVAEAMMRGRLEERVRCADLLGGPYEVPLNLVRIKVASATVQDGGEEWFASQREVEQFLRNLAHEIRKGPK